MKRGIQIQWTPHVPEWYVPSGHEVATICTLYQQQGVTFLPGDRIVIQLLLAGF